MTPLTAAVSGTEYFRGPRFTVALLMAVLVVAAACGGGSEPSEDASSTPSRGAAATPSAEPVSGAPLGTGFIMVSETSQLQLTEGTFSEESDCSARVSALGDPVAYQGCLAVPPTAMCLRVAEGLRESDRWWECFVQEAACEEAIAAHEVIIEVGGYVRELLQRCEETEMASVFAGMQ